MNDPDGNRGRRPTPAGWILLVAVCFVLPGVAAPAGADVLHLTNGGTIEGRIIEQTDTGYRIRTLLGTMVLPRDAVQRIEKKPSVLDEYDRRLAKLADTAAAHLELARWCERVGYPAGRRKHLRRVIELDPDNAAARQALGYARKDGKWVRASAARRKPSSRPADQDAETEVPEEDRRLVAEIQRKWMVRLRAIRRNNLDTSIPRLVQDGRAKIVAIQDPLAILPLARVLAPGSWACREALVTALSHFPQDEATMNLAGIALLDPDASIRRLALAELKRRDDPRVIAEFRRALVTNNDKLILRAAEGLGLLKAKAAVPELISVLTAPRVKSVEVPVQTYLRGYYDSFTGKTHVSVTNGQWVYHAPLLEIPRPWLGPLPLGSRLSARQVTVYRTEVLEALRQITGQDFGFDQQRWRNWYLEQQK